MRRILLFSCMLFFFCGPVHSQERTLSSPCAGVLINGVCWAESNVDRPGTFAATPEAYGMLYQWNRKKGWPPTGTVTGWDNSLPSGNSWEAANDPCPAGWRVPTIEEIATLLDSTKVDYVWVNGGKFTDKVTSNAIFLPANSMRDSEGRAGNTFGTDGMYWSSSFASLGNAWALLFFNDGSLFQFSFFSNFGHAVRCVTDSNVPDCDSIVKDTSETICAGDLPYTWGDTVFQTGTESGKYRFRRTGTVTGCDSIVYLTLTVHPVAHLSFSDAVCSGSGYNENGFLLPAVFADTLVRDTLQSSGGCDSIRSLYLTVHPVYDTPLYDTICQGDSYYQHGFSLANVQSGGFHRLSLFSQLGCDSILSLHLTVLPVFHQALYDSICPSSRYVRHGFDLSDVTGSGTFQLSRETVDGCDSMITLNLHVFPSYLYEYTKNICRGDTIDFRGRRLSESGLYSDTLTTAKGCDSIYCMQLTVHPVYNRTFYDTICQGDSYYQHGFSLANVQSGGFHRLSLLSQSGCDSILSLYLTVLPVFHQTLYDSICPSSRYVRHGFDLSDVTGSGTFQLSRETVGGCDSMITLNLHVFPSYVYEYTKNICRGDTIDFRGRPLSESGIYSDTLTTAKGCDSIYCMKLTVNPVYDIQLSGILCEGSVYAEHDFNVSQAGIYHRYLKTNSGCDSIVTLNLTEEKKLQDSIVFLLEDCATHTYTFFFEPEISVASWQWDMGDGTIFRFGKGVHTYADSGVYRIRLRAETFNGCENMFSYVQYVPHYLPEVQLQADRQILDEDFHTVNFCAEVLPEMSCEWDFGDGTTGQGSCVSHTYNTDTQKDYDVTLSVKNAEGCVTEGRTQVKVVLFPKSVNTFSPNGDGINDFFMTGYRIQIMNRNGLRIYVGDNGWDGTYNGKQAPEDTYFYRLYYQTANGERMKTGYVTLIR